jgi:hypothetical protein
VNDLAAKEPAKLKAMQDLFMQQASINHALPLDDRTIERFNPAIAARPDLMAGRKSLTVYPGVPDMAENAFINIKNRSHTVTADIVVPKENAEGVILAQGGRFGGWSLYVKDGKPAYTYNWPGLKRFNIASDKKLEPGKANLVFKFAYDGGGPARGGSGALFVNGEKVADGRIEQTQCCIFSADEGADVGRDDGTPVTEAYQSPFAFSGTINKVTIDLGDISAADEAAAEPVEEESRTKKALAD